MFNINALDIKTEVVIFGKTQGRTDIIAEDYIGIETKKSMTSERDDALIQVDRFIVQVETKGDSVMPVGIGTDGEIWEFFVRAHDSLFMYHRFVVQKTWSDEDLKQSLLRPLTTIRGEKVAWKLKPTTEAIADVFRPEGPVFKEARTIMLTGAEHILKTHSVEFTAKFTAWFELFNYVYNNFDERCKAVSHEVKDLGKIANTLKTIPHLSNTTLKTLSGAVELFFRHTYMAMLSKILVSTATVGEHQISKQLMEKPSGLASGLLLDEQGIVIAEPNDFFIWTSYDPEVGKLVAAILRPLQRFSTDYDDDIFRYLYEIVVDPETRHELGEFYTPKWLAQLIVKETIQTPDARVLDPACGSGTFLVSALRRKATLVSKTKKLSSEILTQLLEEVWGIDVNPLSVTLARTNLYLALTNLAEIGQIPEEIRPRVYVADTFIVPRFSKEKQDALEVNPNAKIIHVPVTPGISIPVHLEIAVDEMTSLVASVGERIASGQPKLTKSEVSAKFADYILALDEAMRDLKSRYGNNLWQFILRNYCIPPIIRNQFDVVVGNPPWLIFREARANIQKTIEAVAVHAEISPSYKVKTSFNLAVSFLVTSIQFLKKDGTIGFVMPLSVIEGAAHLPFIEALESKRLGKLKNIYDLSKVEPYPFPHSFAPCVLIIEAI